MTPAGELLSAYTQLRADGSTACGCWIYCGAYAGGVNQTARRVPRTEQNWTCPEWAWAWPANRRILYNRASADPEGRPWSERKALVWWDPDAAALGRPRHARLRGRQAARLPAAARRDRPGGDRRNRAVHHAGRRSRLVVRARGRRRRAAADALRAAGLTGPQPAARPPAKSGPSDLRPRVQPLPPGPGRAWLRRIPVFGHDLPADRALHRRRHEPLDAVPVRAAARVLLRGLARTGGRARARAPRLGDARVRPRRRSRRACW